jgi:Serine/Threonine/Tyrosine Kinase found in polyvalent proteins
MNDELRNIIIGISETSTGHSIQTVLRFLRESKTTSRETEKSEFFTKTDEVELLKDFADRNQFWYHEIKEDTYIGEGAEQKVYLEENGLFVIKTNDSIFYETWKDYFISLLIHNYLFPTTAYQLLGFFENTDKTTFYSVVKQPFIESTSPTDLSLLKLFLEKNGFQYKKNNDYFNPELGIILEDLHDENVLTNQGVFFIIDSAIYLMDSLEIE